MTDDKLGDQYVVQMPSARASRRKDDFIWYDKTSGEPKPEISQLWVSGLVADSRFMGHEVYAEPGCWVIAAVAPLSLRQVCEAEPVADGGSQRRLSGPVPTL